MSYMMKRGLTNEELSKSDVRGMIDSKVASMLDSKEFNDKIKDIITDAFENFYKSMYNKRGFWKSFMK